MGGKINQTIPIKGQNTPWPDDSRNNPYMSETFDNFNERCNSTKPIDAHSKGIGGMALHAKK